MGSHKKDAVNLCRRLRRISELKSVMGGFVGKRWVQDAEENWCRHARGLVMCFDPLAGLAYVTLLRDYDINPTS